MATIALNPLNNLTTNLDALVNSLVHTNTYATVPTATSSLVTADDALTSALDTLKQHQANYARILHLREEAQRLEDELKSIIRKAVSLREDVGRVHPGILDDEESSDEDEEQEDTTLPLGTGKSKDVDYHTLLNFAARIGKHNSLAAREAEREADKRKINAIRKKEETSATKIASALGKAGAPTTTNHEEAQLEFQPEKDVLELQALDLEASLAAQRAQQGLGYPDGMMLRMGELGRLQKLREDAMDSSQGDARAADDAVDKELERMIRESELVAAKVDAETEKSLKLEQERRQEQTREKEVKKPSAPVSRPRRESVTQRLPKQAAAPVKRKGINLDFGDDDDDDD